MRERLFSWLDREFIEINAEAKPAATAIEETRSLFERFENVLRRHGLSLDDTVRTRLWAKDRESRDAASKERVRILSGSARSASSSFIAPAYFDSEARVAIELWAMRPARRECRKILKEYEPPITPLRYLIYDSVVVLSGVTAVLPTLEDQMADILPRIEGSLRDAGSTWDNVVQASFLLERSQDCRTLQALFDRRVTADIPRREYFHVDGYSSPGKLIEIEVTAKL